MRLSLVQHVREPTRGRGQPLSHILSKKEGDVTDLQLSSPYSNVNKSKVMKEKIYDEKADYIKTNEELNQIDWENTLKSLEPNDQWERYSDKKLRK